MITKKIQISEFLEQVLGVVIFPTMTLVKCPNCGRETEYIGNEFRPFCSERCKMLDLGSWIDEEYTLPAESTEMTEEDIQMIERALNEQNGRE